MGSFALNLSLLIGGLTAGFFLARYLRRGAGASSATAPAPLNHQQYLEHDEKLLTLSDRFLAETPGLQELPTDRLLLELLAFLHREGELNLKAGAPLCRAVTPEMKRLCGAILYRLRYATDVPSLHVFNEKGAGEFQTAFGTYLGQLVRRDPRFMALAGESPSGAQWPTELTPLRRSA